MVEVQVLDFKMNHMDLVGEELLISEYRLHLYMQE